jgi:hypothetical protein
VATLRVLTGGGQEEYNQASVCARTRSRGLLCFNMSQSNNQLTHNLMSLKRMAYV